MSRASMGGLLPASAYRHGDIVRGYDEGGTYTGIVAEKHEPGVGVQGANEVLVRWDGEEYERSSLGHLVPAELVDPWPVTAEDVLNLRALEHGHVPFRMWSLMLWVFEWRELTGDPLRRALQHVGRSVAQRQRELLLASLSQRGRKPSEEAWWLC